MRRSSIQLAFLAALTALMVALTVLPTAAWGTAATKTKVSKQAIQKSLNSPAEKAQLNKQAQEAISKNPQLEKEVQEYEAKHKSSGAAPQSSEAGTSSVAGGQSLEALANQSRQEEQTASTSTTNTTAAVSTSSTGASTSTVLLIGGLVAVTLLVAIAFFIYRDARSVAPAGEGPLGGSSRTSATQMRKRRAKAKAARRQRKRNR